MICVFVSGRPIKCIMGLYILGQVRLHEGREKITVTHWNNSIEQFLCTLVELSSDCLLFRIGFPSMAPPSPQYSSSLSTSCYLFSFCCPSSPLCISTAQTFFIWLFPSRSCFDLRGSLNMSSEARKPPTPSIRKNNEEFLYPTSQLDPCSTIWPEMIGPNAMARFSNTSMIPKADPTILLLTTIGMEGMMQFAQKQQPSPSSISPQEAPDHVGSPSPSHCGYTYTSKCASMKMNMPTTIR